MLKFGTEVKFTYDMSQNCLPQKQQFKVSYNLKRELLSFEITQTHLYMNLYRSFVFQYNPSSPVWRNNILGNLKIWHIEATIVNKVKCYKILLDFDCVPFLHE